MLEMWKLEDNNGYKNYQQGKNSIEATDALDKVDSRQIQIIGDIKEPD